jgi:hypothetical protein
MAAMDRSVAWRAALLQGACVAVIAVVLGLALEKSFFEDWGWLAGPGAWALCALVCAAVLRLPALMVLVLAGVHWAGTPLALLLFGLWCGWLAARGDRARRGRRHRTAASRPVEA